MVKYKIFIFVFSQLFFFFLCRTFGQSPQPVFKTYTSADGLSYSDVNNTQFDRHGYLWVSTNYGLNKFDGIQFNSYLAFTGNQNGGLSGNVVKQVLCDSLVTWAAIDNGGINCYFNRIDHFAKYNHDPRDSFSLVSDSVNCLFLSRDKDLYVGTRNGLSIFDRDISKFKSIVKHPTFNRDLNITSFAQSKDGTIWLGTNKQGLLYCDQSAGIHVASQFSNLLNSAIINDLMYYEEKDQLWLATTNGLWYADMQSNRSGYQYLFFFRY